MCSFSSRTAADARCRGAACAAGRVPGLLSGHARCQPAPAQSAAPSHTPAACVVWSPVQDACTCIHAGDKMVPVNSRLYKPIKR